MQNKESDNYFEKPAVKVHKQQRTWQILFPVLFAGLIVLLIMVWLIAFDGRIHPDINNLAGVSVILLSLPFFFFALVKLVLLVGMIYGLAKLKPLIPKAGTKFLQAFETVRWHIRKGADISVQPVLSLNQTSEKAKQVVRSFNNKLIKRRN